MVEGHQAAAGSGNSPLGQALQLDAADDALQFGEAEVGAVAAAPRSSSARAANGSLGMFAPDNRLRVLPWSLQAQMASQRSARLVDTMPLTDWP
jgi:hypothetical protein